MANNRVFGTVTCPVCGCAHAQAKELASGAFIVCPPMHDGGCNTQVFGRSRAAREAIAKKVNKWNDPDVRKEILGAAPAAPKKAAAPKKPAATPEPDPMPDPDPTPDPINNPPPKLPKKVLGGLLEW